MQTCEECPNVKLDREGEYITVDVEKGMKEGQVRMNAPRPSAHRIRMEEWSALLYRVLRAFDSIFCRRFFGIIPVMTGGQRKVDSHKTSGGL
jgi:hypothetical protein